MGSDFKGEEDGRLSYHFPWPFWILTWNNQRVNSFRRICAVSSIFPFRQPRRERTARRLAEGPQRPQMIGQVPRFFVAADYFPEAQNFGIV
jgi:hypothetical protein